MPACAHLSNGITQQGLSKISTFMRVAMVLPCHIATAVFFF